MKTSELTGVALDWAVAKVLRPDLVAFADYGSIFPWRKKFKVCFIGYDAPFEPSTNPAHSVPIMESERIIVLNIKMKWGVEYQRQGFWVANMWRGEGSNPRFATAIGDTMLIAGMRCYVASELGDEVEIPEELK